MFIGILQSGHFVKRTGVPDREYNDLFEALLKGRGLTFRTWNVVDMEFPESVDEAEGWLITGSRHGVYDDVPFIKPLEDFICQAYARSVPMVGICFGHQIIAQALGGRVEKFSDGWSIGRQTYDFQGETVALNAWHQDQVVEKPARAETIASSPFCEYAALLYEGKAFTVQAHPEFDEMAMDTLLKYRAPGLVPDPLIEAASETVTTENDHQRLADQIAAFFKEAAHG